MKVQRTQNLLRFYLEKLQLDLEELIGAISEIIVTFECFLKLDGFSPV